MATRVAINGFGRVGRAVGIFCDMKQMQRGAILHRDASRIFQRGIRWWTEIDGDENALEHNLLRVQCSRGRTTNSRDKHRLRRGTARCPMGIFQQSANSFAWRRRGDRCVMCHASISAILASRMAVCFLKSVRPEFIHDARNVRRRRKSVRQQRICPECRARQAGLYRFQVRRLSLDLRPAQLDDLGLVAALRGHADRQAAVGRFTAHFETRGLPKRLNTKIETACFRVSQEALTNILRHARAANVWIDLSADQNQVTLTVRDDGVGFVVEDGTNRATTGESLGLLSMEERIALIGGNLTVQSQPGKGTEVRARVPLPVEGRK